MDEKSLASTVTLLKFLVPMLDEFLADIIQGHGFLNLPPKLFPLLQRFDTFSWAQYYESRPKMKALLAAIYLQLNPGDGEVLKGLTADEKRNFSEALKQSAITGLTSNPDAFHFDLPTEDEAKAYLEQASEEDLKGGNVLITLICLFLMTHVCTFLALMSFGQTMCDLVEKAKNGDDDAFCSAVQVDRTVLLGIPYFRQRLLTAQIGSEPMFLNNLANAIKGRSLSKKLSYPKLMLVFYMLDDEGFLDMPLEKLFSLCEELGIYGREFGVEDIGSLSKRRLRYRKLTGRQIRF